MRTMRNEVLRPLSPNESYCCENGCGECTPKQIDFEYSREETLEGELIDSKKRKIWVSRCCGVSMVIYNETTGNTRDATMDDALDTAFDTAFDMVFRRITETAPDTPMTTKIKEVLHLIEQEENCIILFAAEAGSRAWGFESPDSDYDVRYIYVRPRNWYLTIDAGRDVIDTYHKQPYIAGTEYDDKLMDVTGWDIQKMGKMLRKSNPQLLEWINSPAIYRATETSLFKRLAEKSLNMLPVVAHYRAMARGNFREYLQTPEVRYKKYLYVIRPLLAARYAIEYNAFPPVAFDKLCEATLKFYPRYPELGLSIAKLLAVKRLSSEIDAAPSDPVLHAWIKDEAFLPDGDFPDDRGPLTDYLNDELVPLINSYNGFML